MGLFQGDAEPGREHVMSWDENMELREREGHDKVTGKRHSMRKLKLDYDTGT